MIGRLQDTKEKMVTGQVSVELQEYYNSTILLARLVFARHYSLANYFLLVVVMLDPNNLPH